MKYGFIREWHSEYPVTVLCRVMQVSSSAYYNWRGRGGELIDSETWQLCHRMKALFNESRQSLGSRQLMKQLRKEGFEIGRYRVRKLMKKLDLVVKRKKRFVLTTDSKHALPVAENVLNRDFTPTEKNRVWTTDITYIWTLQGWVYLAVVIDLYSRRVVGWHVDRRMETALASRAVIPPKNSSAQKWNFLVMCTEEIPHAQVPIHRQSDHQHSQAGGGRYTGARPVP